MKYIFIAGAIGWLIGMSLKNVRLAVLAIPTLYGLALRFLFPVWTEQHRVLSYGIAYAMYALIALSWIVSVIRVISDKVFERRLEREAELRFVEELKRRQAGYPFIRE